MASLTAQDATRLSAEVENELSQLDQVVTAVVTRSTIPDDTTAYAIALLLMNYYTGVENLFRRIAAQLGGLPAGDRWHTQLLEDMRLDLPGIRPAVLSSATTEELSDLLRFRHVLRNLYVWSIRRGDLERHASQLPKTHASLQADVRRFLGFLAALAAA